MNKKRAKEDYLRMLYELHNNNGIRNIDIASNLQISKASVSEMLRKLHKEKLVMIKPYSKILLTNKGKKHGEKCYDKHRIIKKFMQKIINETTDEKEAHHLEHAFSDETIEIFKGILFNNKITSFPNYV